MRGSMVRTHQVSKKTKPLSARTEVFFCFETCKSKFICFYGFEMRASGASTMTESAFVRGTSVSLARPKGTHQAKQNLCPQGQRFFSGLVKANFAPEQLEVSVLTTPNPFRRSVVGVRRPVSALTQNSCLLSRLASRQWSFTCETH